MNDAQHNGPSISGGITPLGGRAFRRGEGLGQFAAGRWPIHRPTVRHCPVCEQENRETADFCLNCATSLADVAPTLSFLDAGTRAALGHSFADVRRPPPRRQTNEGVGGGFISLGLMVLGVAVVMAGESTVRQGMWAVGVIATVIGFWRMRHDLRGLTRVGAMISAGTLLLLGIITIQLTGLPQVGGFGAAPPVPATVEPTEVPDWEQAAAASPAAAPASAGVPMFRGNPAHTGVHPGPGPTGNPTLAWRLDTAGELYSSPAVVDGIVYVAGKTGFLYALDAATGEEQWRFDLGDYVVRSSPAVANGIVYVGGGFHLFAIDTVTGLERWRFKMTYAGQASPVVVGGVVYVTSQEGHVYAIDARTGQERWSFEADALIFSSPAVAGDNLFFGTDDGDLYAVGLERGNIRWRFPAGGEIYASPAVASDTVFVTSTSGFTHAVDIETGRARWRTGVGGDASPAVAGDTLYVGSDDGGLYAFAVSDGTSRWLFPTGSPVSSSPAVAGDTLYVGSGRTLYAVDRQTGTRNWYYATTDTIDSSPAVVGGTVFVGSRDGFLYAVTGDGT